jgi:hypothetical protein
VGNRSQVNILKSRGRLLYSKHPVGFKSSREEPMWEVVAVLQLNPDIYE